MTTTITPEGERSTIYERLGTRVLDRQLPSEVVAPAAIRTEPVYTLGADGDPIQVPGRIAVMGDADQVFGIAGRRYRPLDLKQILPALDEFAATHPLISTGTYRNGAELFLCFDRGDATVLGEEYRRYLVVVHPYRPGVSWQLIPASVRVYCHNQLPAVARSSHVIRIPHGRRVDTESLAALMGAHGRRSDAESDQFIERLARVKLTSPEVRENLERIYGMYAASDATLRRTGREADTRVRDSLVLRAMERYEVTAESFPPDLRGTAYHVLQTVVEIADHRGKATSDSPLVGSRFVEKQRAAAVLGRLARGEEP